MTAWLNNWKALWNPNRFHGWGKNKNYFEGWYFKMVSADESLAIAFIPGVAMDDQGKKHAFIQIMDGTNERSEYLEFSFDDFICSADEFDVQIGQNYFSEKRVVLDHELISAEIKIEKITPWPKSLGAPGIMGWYSFVPFMQCNHGVVSLYHQLSGSMEYGGRTHDFNGGIGYIEKDWGRSFPKSWIWMQSNHFESSDSPISLMASVAHIPWVGSYFIGFLVGFYLEDRLYKFATYTGAKHKGEITDDGVDLIFTQGKLTLEINALKGPTAELISPISGEMRGKVNESLQAKLHVKLTENKVVIYEGTGSHAGLELAGDTPGLLS